jgi:hypothetical protein
MVGELKPCPFCGSTDVQDVINIHRKSIAVRCNECFCYGPRVVLEPEVASVEAGIAEVKRLWGFVSEVLPGSKVDFYQLYSLLKEASGPSAVKYVGHNTKNPLTLFSSQISLLEFLRIAEQLIELYPFLYVEIARTRTTGWMVWLRVSPDGKLLANGQGEELDHACKDAIKALTASGGANA